jgi:hypothetical protein
MQFRRTLLIAVSLLLLLTSSAYAKRVHISSTVETPQLIPTFPPLVTSYDVYLGGLHLIAAQVWFEEKGKFYHANVKAQTVGLIGRFFPWNTVLDGEGAIDGDHFVPHEFFTRDDWAHKPKITMLHFDGKGNVVPEFDPPNHDENREIVTLEQRRNALDPITALLQMLAHVAVQKSCAIPVPIFDGKRRFDIIGRDSGTEMINDEEYNIFKGDARLCDADFKMISGEWKDREHARFWQKTETESGREPFHIWLASVAPQLPEIPVRLESGSIAGLIVVQLTAWRYATEDEVKQQGEFLHKSETPYMPRPLR